MIKERLQNAWKALTSEVKSIPTPSIGYGSGFGYSSPASGLQGMPGWVGNPSMFPGTKIDYSTEVGDLSRSSLVMAAVNFHGTTLPEAPLEIMQTVEGNLVPVPNHPLKTLLDNPNPFYPGELLWKAFSLDWLTNGNVYWHKERNALGKVIRLWPFPSAYVRAFWPRTTQEKELFDDFLKAQGWSTEGSDFISWYELSDGRQWYRVPKEDVVHFRCNIDPTNNRFAVSPLASVLREIFTDNQRANLNAVLMKNMGITPWILAPTEPGTQIEKEHRDEIKEAAVRNTTGDNTGKPLVLAGPMKPYKLSLTPQEMLIKDASIIPETRIAAVTGIPAIVLNFWAGLLRGTYANYEQAKRQAYEAKIKPDQRLIAGTLRTSLLSEFKGEGDFIHFDISHVQALSEDENQRAERFGKMYQAGFIKRSEARSGMGYGSSAGLEKSQVDEVFFDPRGGSVIKPGDDIIGGQQPDDATPTGKSIKSVPSDADQQEAVEWWDENAPDDAKDLINAKKPNGDSKVL